MFGQNIKKLKILKLSRDFRYLQKLALKYQWSIFHTIISHSIFWNLFKVLSLRQKPKRASNLKFSHPLDSMYSWNILLGSSMFFRIRFEYSSIFELLQTHAHEYPVRIVYQCRIFKAFVLFTDPQHMDYLEWTTEMYSTWMDGLMDYLKGLPYITYLEKKDSQSLVVLMVVPLPSPSWFLSVCLFFYGAGQLCYRHIHSSRVMADTLGGE